jgi:hypothetical protein
VRLKRSTRGGDAPVAPMEPPRAHDAMQAVDPRLGGAPMTERAPTDRLRSGVPGRGSSMTSSTAWACARPAPHRPHGRALPTPCPPRGIPRD